LEYDDAVWFFVALVLQKEPHGVVITQKIAFFTVEKSLTYRMFAIYYILLREGSVLNEGLRNYYLSL
jgi:hypothetical protein